MKFHEFKVVAKLPSASNVIRGEYYSKAYNKVLTLFKDGTIKEGSALPAEVPSVHEILLTERVSNDNQEVFWQGSFKFVPEELEEDYFKEVKDRYTVDALRMEKNKNYLTRQMYKFLQHHDHIVIKDAYDNNINSNCTTNAFYELIDVTKNELEEAKINKLILKCGTLLNELYNDEKEFELFCYAYSIPAIDVLTREKLYNLCMQKITNDPDEFIEIYQSKNREILVMVNLGLSKNIGTEYQPKYAIEVTQAGTYYLNGEPVAGNKKEFEDLITYDPQKRRLLSMLVGMDKTTKPEPKKNEKEEAVVQKIVSGEVAKFQDIMEEGKKNKSDIEMLKTDFRFKANPIISRTKDELDKENKLKTLLSDEKFAQINAWAVDYVAKQKEKVAIKNASKVE